MSIGELQRKISDLAPWYHNVELRPGVWTNPDKGDYPRQRWEVIAPHVPLDLTDKSVLDLGCSSGYFSVMMKRRGARKVVAVDEHERAAGQAKLLSSELGVPIDVIQANIYDFLLSNQETFDHVFFLGVLYHLRSPLFVLDQISKVVTERLYFQTVTRSEPSVFYRLHLAVYAAERAAMMARDGRAITEIIGESARTLIGRDTIPRDLSNRRSDLVVLDHPGFPRAWLTEGKVGGDPTNWWFANRACVEAMLRTSGFDRFTRVSSDVYVCGAPDSPPTRRPFLWDRFSARYADHETAAGANPE
ncbi:MAG: class I SAM-dependent methyltransferase [Chloroflexota bacterium]